MTPKFDSQAFSHFDRQLGYYPGLVNVVALLLTQMPAEESFYTLVSLVKNYGFRQFFRAGQEELRLETIAFSFLLNMVEPKIARRLVSPSRSLCTVRVPLTTFALSSANSRSNLVITSHSGSQPSSYRFFPFRRSFESSIVSSSTRKPAIARHSQFFSYRNIPIPSDSHLAMPLSTIS